jgi:two-component system response regulator AtoC
MVESEKILIVEDDVSFCALLVDEVEDAGYRVRSAHTVEEARATLAEWPPDLVLCDLRLPGADGLTFLRLTRELALPPAFILITAFGTVPQAVEALKAGADDFLTKPLDLDHLRLRLARTLENRRLRREIRHFHEQFGRGDFRGMVGRSEVMRVLFEQIRRVAQAAGPVLIIGESGTGKELVARAIHEESNRADKAFIAVNCAGVPEDLLESEFFGHLAGAFTGAARARKGLFAEAVGGTLFLDEIAEMPVNLQAKLLRVLQEGRMRPVGSDKEQPVDARVVAATNRDLERAVASGQFRTDLYYRLETFVLQVPALRERGKDRELLAGRFIAQFSAQAGRLNLTLSESALELVKRYSFPGNVRELQNAMERAVTFCTGNVIEREHLPARLRERGEGQSTVEHTIGLPMPMLRNAEQLVTLAELEERYIDYVLKRVGGNKRRAAALLGIGRRTLYRRLGEDDFSASK